MQILTYCSQRTSCCSALFWIGPLEAHFLCLCRKFTRAVRSSQAWVVQSPVGIGHSIGILYK